MLNARSIATLGIGFGAGQVARIGLWPTGERPKKPSVELLGGGGSYRPFSGPQSEAEKREERERLGIIPAEAKRAIEVVARIEARSVNAETEQRALEALAVEIERIELEWRDYYAELLRDALRRVIAEQDEEQAILLLLSEM